MLAAPCGRGVRLPAKSLHGLIHGVVNIEDGHQFGDLQDPLEAGTEVRQFDVAAGGTGGAEQADHYAQPAAIDVGSVLQVNDDAGRPGQERRLDGGAQIAGIIAEINAAITGQDGDSFHFAAGYAESQSPSTNLTMRLAVAGEVFKTGYKRRQRDASKNELARVPRRRGSWGKGPERGQQGEW